MSSIESLMFQLTSGLINETAIPTQYLQIPEINEIIIRYNWIIRGSVVPGWTTLVRHVNYSS
jgi:hypothetical protein